jgi:single-strand DNA-binding protein
MNRWVGIGRLTRDADVRNTQNQNGENMAIARYTLAVDRRGKDAGADFISCVAFGKNAEFAEKYLHQGMKIGISGRIQTGNYTNKDGQKVYTTDVVVEEQEFCESKASDQPKEQNNGFVKVPEGIENDLPWK